MILHVYQPTLSDAQIKEVNEGGWSKHEAYVKATMILSDGDAAKGTVLAATDYFKHNWTVDVVGIDEAFEVLNVAHHHATWKAQDGAKSMSVGDVAITLDAKHAYICAPFGWMKMTEAEAKEFQTKVATHIAA